MKRFLPLFAAFLFAVVPAQGQTSVGLTFAHEVGHEQFARPGFGLDVVHSPNTFGLYGGASVSESGTSALVGPTVAVTNTVDLAIGVGVNRRIKQTRGQSRTAAVVDSFAGLRIGDSQKHMLVGVKVATPHQYGWDNWHPTLTKSSWADQVRLVLSIGPAF